ncbi:MAG: hypothetical protein HY508_02755 [Acidobacteria bacterium]|nr:hypothetical protein [Acidobacteriota bacterium]
MALEALPAQGPKALGAELKPATSEAFERYARATEARIDRELARPDAFLYTEGLPAPRRDAVRAMLKRGEVYMERLQMRDSSSKDMKAPDALIHHWLGAAFIPCVTLQQTLELVQDYDRHQDIYKPEVVRSKLVSRKGPDFKIFYRLRKKKVRTVTLNTDHEVHYTLLSAQRTVSRSYTTRIQQVSDADTPQEHEEPVGKDSGYLWRLYSYWRFEERDGGVYIECESISLTRDIPFGFGWLVKPFVMDIPEESLQMTMGSTRRALLANVSESCKQQAEGE